MSKSRGNFLVVRDLTGADGRTDWGAPVDPLALRLTLISGHYGKPFNLTRATLEAAQKNLRRYREADAAAAAALAAGREGGDTLSEGLEAAYGDALRAMADDLNTPEALAAAYRGANDVLRRHHDGGLTRREGEAALLFLDRVNALLGIVRAEYDVAPAAAAEDGGLEARVDDLLRRRAEARTRKDFSEADRLRDEAAALGVEVMDTPQGTTWRKL